MFVLETCVVLFSGLSHCRAEPRGGHVLWGRVPLALWKVLPHQSTAAVWGPLFPALLPRLHNPQGSELAPSFLLFAFSRHQDFAEHFNPYHLGRLGNRFICKSWHTSYREMLKGDFFKVKTILSVGLKSNVASRNQLFSFWGSFIISCLYLGLVITWK